MAYLFHHKANQSAAGILFDFPHFLRVVSHCTTEAPMENSSISVE